MKNKILNGMALATMALLVLACTPKKEEAAAAPAVDKDKIKAEIQAMEDAFAASYNAGKADGIMYYADDAKSYSQNKEPLDGKTAIENYIKEDMKTFPKGAKLAFMAEDVFPSSDGNQVVEIGNYKMTDSTNTVKASGHYISLFEKRDGKYLCVRDMGASDMPKKEEEKK